MNPTKTRMLSAASWVFALVASMVVAGCSKDSEKPSADAAAKQFPGYQQVGSSGDAAQLWFDPANVPRSGSSYVIHALKAFPQGYARFDVATNCRGRWDRRARIPWERQRSPGEVRTGHD
jgi:hypothetical protein